MTLRSALSPLLLGALALVAAGCSTSGVQVNIDTWKQSVEEYVREAGKGDPIVLRDTTYKGRPAFAQIGHPVPAQSTDAIALLLGHRQIQNRPSFIYLLGLNEKETLEDVRIVVLQPAPSRDGQTQFRWLLSQRADEQVRKYLAHRADLYKRRFPGEGSPPPAYTTFPADEDAFDLNLSTNRLLITHLTSGAAWGLNFGSTPIASRP